MPNRQKNDEKKKQQEGLQRVCVRSFSVRMFGSLIYISEGTSKTVFKKNERKSFRILKLVNSFRWGAKNLVGNKPDLVLGYIIYWQGYKKSKSKWMEVKLRVYLRHGV